MSDEAQAKMILALGNAVNLLIEQAERQQKSVQGILANSSKAIDVVSIAGKEHRDLARELPKQVKEAIDGALEGAAREAARILTSKFTEADEQAQRAASRYERTARTLNWKAILIVTVAWVATVAIAVMMVWYTGAENQALRQDRATLKAVMTYLEMSPQGAQITRCGTPSNSLCVYVQTTRNGWELQMLAGPTGSLSKQ